jgi:exo-beta-1,3-glucanase (GH17 family)
MNVTGDGESRCDGGNFLFNHMKSSELSAGNRISRERSNRRSWVGALLLLAILPLGVLMVGGKVVGASTAQWYFAEGYTGEGFQEYLCIANSGSSAADVTATYSFSRGAVQVAHYAVPAGSRTTVNVNQAVGEGREVSLVLSSQQQDLAVERPMYFNYMKKWEGSHVVSGAPAPSRSWYFAEGYTGAGFDEYVCVLNPQEAPASIKFRFQTTAGGEVVRGGRTISPRSRATFKVNDLLGQGYESSIALESDLAVVAERSTYFEYSGRNEARWKGGHCVMGASAPSDQFYFAEGTTRGGFDEWLTIQNPNASALDVSAAYQLGAGQGAPISKTYHLAPMQRYTVFVPDEVPRGSDVSVKLTGSQAFLAERPMYFGFNNSGLYFEGGHCAAGAHAPTSSQFFAEGYTGPGFEEWLCLQNCGETQSVVRIDYYTQEAGTLSPRTTVIPPGTRQTVLVNESAGPGYQLATRVTVTGGPNIVAERPMYFDKTRLPVVQEPPPPVGGHLDGLCFSPYLTGSPDQDVTAARLDYLFSKVAPYTDSIRGFGSRDIDVTLYEKARAQGLKVAGAADIRTDPGWNNAELAALKDLCNKKRLDFAIVGDETMDDMDGPPLSDEATTIGYINSVRAGSAGVPVGSSQSYYVWEQHPNLVKACDFIGFNVYPFWNGLSWSDSLTFIDQQYHEMLGLAQGRPIYIQTGWPSAGSTNGAAGPSPRNSAIFMSKFMEWAKAAGAHYWYFDAFDEDWKTEEGNVGPHWGIWDNNASLKPQNAAFLTPK